MRIIAVCNIKGGVGKTTTAVNLAYLAAASGQETVLWDLDPQGAATWILGGEPRAEAPARQLVQGRAELSGQVTPTAWAHLGLVAADFSDRNFDLHISERKHRTERLLRMSRSLRESCRLLVLDCPPGMSLLSENVLRAADALVVPMLPAPLSLRMLEQLRAFVAAEGWSDLQILPFFSMVDRRRALHAEIIAEARENLPLILATEVPDWSEIERMTLRRAPLPAVTPHSPGALVYQALWREITSTARSLRAR
jgi:cellulose biosynthesis protein BcsQ